MNRIIIIHYHEIALKGRNRDFFEEYLVRNIEKALIGESVSGIFRLFDRILVALSGNSNIELIKSKLQKVFGIAYFAVGFESGRTTLSFPRMRESIRPSLRGTKPARTTIQSGRQSPDLEILGDDIWNTIKEENFKTFRITTKRQDKSYQYDSREVDKIIGSYIWERLEESGKAPKVDLKNPDINIVIEITSGGTFFYFSGCHCEERLAREILRYRSGQAPQSCGKIRGLSGFPVGTAGKVVSLISGGFDSPVASWKIMRRGAEVIFVHFHSYPSTSLASKENVREIIKILNQYQYESKIYFVPFLDIQKQIMLNCDPSYGVILYRRFMLRIAERIAEKENAKALITGDSLAQVASQTLENIATVSKIATMPIFRPLIGENKEDIIELAGKIGTSEISSRPYEDCCSLFIPKNPQTRASLKIVEELEKKSDIDGLIASAIEKTEIEIIK